METPGGENLKKHMMFLAIAVSVVLFGAFLATAEGDDDDDDSDEGLLQPYQVSLQQQTLPKTTVTLTPLCNAGDSVISGGWKLDGWIPVSQSPASPTPATVLIVTEDAPLSTNDGWVVVFDNQDGLGNLPILVTAYAICI